LCGFVGYYIVRLEIYKQLIRGGKAHIVVTALVFLYIVSTLGKVDRGEVSKGFVLRVFLPLYVIRVLVLIPRGGRVLELLVLRVI
jgi:hypothetical protein